MTREDLRIQAREGKAREERGEGEKEIKEGENEMPTHSVSHCAPCDARHVLYAHLTPPCELRSGPARSEKRGPKRLPFFGR